MVCVTREGMPIMKKLDYFISYNKADKAWAKKIAALMEKNEYAVHVQAWDIRMGSDFLWKMNKFLENSQGFIAVASDDYFASPYCRIEFGAAFDKYLRSDGEYRF